MPTIPFLADEMNECILIHVRFAGTSTPHSPMALPQVLPGLRFQILPLCLAVSNSKPLCLVISKPKFSYPLCPGMSNTLFPFTSRH